MNSAVKNIIFWVVMAVTALLIWAVVKSSTGERVADLTFTEFTSRVNKDEIKDVTIAGTDVTGTFKKDNSHFKTTIPANYPDLYKTLQDKNVNTVIKDNSGNNWMTWLANGLPLILILGLWIFIMRQMQSGGNKALSFGKSRARLHSSQQKKITFKDVAGVEEAKEELHEIIEFLREPQKFQKSGWAYSQRRAAGRPSGNRKDLAGAGHCGRGQCSLLLHLRVRFC